MKYTFSLSIFFILTFNSFGQSSNESKSTFYVDSIFSKSLNEYRKMNVYLPKDFVNGQPYPIIYATDGNKLSLEQFDNNNYRLILDSLIQGKFIPPLIYIESYSNPKRVEPIMYTEDGQIVSWQYRNYEYRELMSQESKDSILHLRFNQHFTYFTEELIPTIEHEFSLPDDRDNRYFFGYSNGGAFGVNMAFKRPDLISTYLCFSTFGSNIERLNWNSEIKYPLLYLEYGDQENLSFQWESEAIAKRCTELKIPFRINKYRGDHDPLIWQEKFASTLLEIFD